MRIFSIIHAGEWNFKLFFIKMLLFSYLFINTAQVESDEPLQPFDTGSGKFTSAGFSVSGLRATKSLRVPMGVDFALCVDFAHCVHFAQCVHFALCALYSLLSEENRPGEGRSFRPQQIRHGETPEVFSPDIDFDLGLILHPAVQNRYTNSPPVTALGNFTAEAFALEDTVRSHRPAGHPTDLPLPGKNGRSLPCDASIKQGEAA